MKFEGGIRFQRVCNKKLESKPLISVVTVVFNGAETLEYTIRSIIEQTYDNIEYIIIDGGSTDATLDILRKYDNSIDYWVSEKDAGIYDAMNKGISLATGDVVGILNSDDIFEYPNVITDIANKFKSNPELSLVFGDVVFVEPANIKKVTRYYTSNKFRPWKLRFGWMPPHPASFIKRSVYNKIGNYSLNYKIAADYEFFIRMLMGYKLSYSRINKVLVRMRTGGISTSGFRNSLLLNTEIVKACKSNGIYTNLFFVLLKIPFKILELFRNSKDVV